MAIDQRVGHPGESCPQIGVLDGHVPGSGPDFTGGGLGCGDRQSGHRTVPIELGSQLDLQVGDGPRITTPAQVGGLSVRQIRDKLSCSRFRVVCHDDIDHAAASGRARGVTAFLETGEVRCRQRGIERQQSGPESSGAGGTAGPLISEPHRDRILNRSRCDTTLRQQVPHRREHRVGDVVPGAKIRSECVELLPGPPGSESEFESAARDQVHEGRFFRDMDGMPVGGEQHGCTDPDAFGPRGDRGREGQRLWQVAVLEEVMFGQPHRVRAEFLGPGDPIEHHTVMLGAGTLPAGRVAHVEEESEFHEGSRVLSVGAAG